MKQIGRAMKRVGMLPLAGLALAALAGGCTTIHDHRGYLIDKALVDSVQPGVDNRLSVERTLGRPTLISQFGEPVWYYVSVDTATPATRSPHITQETVLRLRFDKAGNLVSLDRAGMEKAVHINPDGTITPTLGRQRTFLQDLFGNIGSVGTGGIGGGGGAGGGGGGGGPNGS